MADEVDLQRRVEILEAEVRELRAQMQELGAQTGDVDSPPPPRTAVQDPPPPVSSEPVHPEPVGPTPAVETGAGIGGTIAKVGMLLLLLGVGFLLKYGYDQGWLTETTRAGLGGLTGIVLLATGLLQRRTNAMLSAVLLGGAVVTFYGSTFAAFTLYALIGWSFAMACMVGTSMLGSALALTQDRPSLASISAIGALSTPFLLETPEGSVEMLAGYTIVVLMGTTAIYVLRGWPSLLFSAGLGGLAVMAMLVGLGDNPETATAVVLVVASILAVVASSSMAPMIRSRGESRELSGLEQGFVLFVPTAAIWLFSKLIRDSVVLEAGLVAGLGLAYFALRALATANARTCTVIASTLTGAALGILVGIEPLVTALAGFAIAAHAFGAAGPQALRVAGYPALAALGIWSFALLFTDVVAPPFINASGLHLVLAVATLLAVAWTYQGSVARWIHVYVATIAGMIVVVHQLTDTAGGDVIATSVWGVFALTMLVAGVVREHGKAQALGLAVILITAAKLLIFDLESVSTIWRVVLFMTFGAAMLTISYLVPRWQNRAK